MWSLGDRDASEPLTAPISLGFIEILLLDAASHQPELEPRPPIMAVREGEATNLTYDTDLFP